MQKNMQKNIFERYNIEIPENVDAFNLMSVDYGDGEVSASIIQWNSVDECFGYKRLAVFEDGVTYKAPNAYYISENHEDMVFSATSSDKDMGNRYYNFKKCPGTEEFNSKFMKDDGGLAELTYGEVMAKGFNILMHVLFEANRAVLNRNLPTIVIVGRPSSKGWATHEMDYASLLQDGLNMSDITKKPIYVAVESEALSALAREIDPRWGEKSVGRGEAVVILDNGSSTFDITVIGKDGIPQNGEDSYQFGGNLIDENLMALLKEKIENSGKKLISYHGHKLGLRLKKEEYYGLLGESRMTVIYAANLQGNPDAKGRPPKDEFSINDRTIEQALEEMPVVVRHLDDMVGGVRSNKGKVYSSWIEGCRMIYRAFYDKTSFAFSKYGDAAHPKVPDRIIMSGGVSVMPEVKEIVEEVFGIAPVLANCPNYAVSEGLAYVLSCEVQKMLLLNELKEEMKKWLPGEEELRKDIANCGADWVWESLLDVMEQWINSIKYNSIQEIDEIFDPLWEEKYRYHLDTIVRNGCEKWYQDNDICKKINEELQKKYEKLFPQYANEFEYKLPNIDFQSLEGVAVYVAVTNYDFFFTDLDYSERRPQRLDWTAGRDSSWKNRAYQHLCSIKNEVYNGGIHRHYHYVDVSYGPFGLLTREERRLMYEFSHNGFINDFKKEITHEVSDNIREEIWKLLCEQMKDYVEAITPYFMMAEKQ